MTNINIELQEELHTKLKIKAIKEGKTLQQVVIEVLSRKVKK